MKTINSANVDFMSLSENLGFARVTATSFASQCDFTLEEIQDIKLAVSEAVSNCIIHAYAKSSGTIYMNFELKSEEGIEKPTMFSVTIKDEGVGIFNLEEAKNPGFSSDPERMGMGLTLMEALADNFSIISEPNMGTEVIMEFSPKERDTFAFNDENFIRDGGN